MAEKCRSWKTTLWKTVSCKERGDKCWCRGIKAETGKIVVFSGKIRKELAEFIVKEHNELLRRRKNDD